MKHVNRSSSLIMCLVFKENINILLTDAHLPKVDSHSEELKAIERLQAKASKGEKS